MAHIYYIDRLTGKIKGHAECSSWTAKQDIDFADKSTAIVTERPDLNDDDMIALKEGREMLFFGICDTVNTGPPYTLNLLQAENIFDRTVFDDDEELIQSGMEQYITISGRKNFVNSGDELFDKKYLSIVPKSMTPVSASIASTVTTENGVFNFKTFLGNVKQKYGIFITFTPKNGSLLAEVRADPNPVLKIDTRAPDIMELKETYAVDVLARLNVRWRVSGSEDEPEERTFFLREDRSVTEDPESAARVSGTVAAAFIEAEDESAMLQEVKNRFTANSYNHRMTMQIRKGSKLYPESGLYVGRKVRVKSERTGLITDTIISRREESSGSDIIYLTLGTLPVSLVEKIRRLS